MVKIVKATEQHIPHLVSLFDQYRVFYKQESDIKSATDFLNQRFAKNESVVLLAYYENEPVGFIQLYPSFSSVSMQPIFILNDLFVSHEHRGKKIGSNLLKQSQSYCNQMEYKGLVLETAIDNPAQSLYERLGWEKDLHSFHYFWEA